MQSYTALPARSSDTLTTFPIRTGKSATEVCITVLRFGTVVIAFFLVAPVFDRAAALTYFGAFRGLNPMSIAELRSN
jgi:hypothetical protein